MNDINVVTLQDLSCFGKCSSTVALPIISAMGISCAVIPTAVLSTHTGGFKGYTFRDLTDDIPLISDHWVREGLTFDGIYTGYLGGAHQVRVTAEFIARHRANGFVFVDPAMADNGRLYSGLDASHVVAMRELCSCADMIVPNITEASLMLGREFIPRGYSSDYIEGMLRELCSLGCRKALLTGVSYEEGQCGCVCYDSESESFEVYFNENIPVESHGTGDVFASVLFGSLMLGLPLARAMKLAADFTVRSIKATVGDENHRYGVKFEKCLPMLIDSLRMSKE